jgi:hypothetical protein
LQRCLDWNLLQFLAYYNILFYLVPAGMINIIKLLVYGLLDMMRFVSVLSNLFHYCQLGNKCKNNIFYQKKIFWCKKMHMKVVISIYYSLWNWYLNMVTGKAVWDWIELVSVHHLCSLTHLLTVFFFHMAVKDAFATRACTWRC